MAKPVEAPQEIALAAIGSAILGTFFVAVLASGMVDHAQFAGLFRAYLLSGFAVWAEVGLIGLLVLLWRNRPKEGPGASPLLVTARWLAARWRRDRFVSLFWPPLMATMLIPSFNAFKQQILGAQGFSFDDRLAAVDRILFLGHDGWRVAHAIVGGPIATRAIDWLYSLWLLPMLLGVMLCAYVGQADFRTRAQYLLTWLLCWIVTGGLLAYLMPSAGPIFYTALIGPNESFGALRALLVAQGEAFSPFGDQLQAILTAGGLIAARGADQLVIGAGISAMPSVHNGLAVLFALGARRVNRRFGQAMTGYAAFIWFGSIYLGWHYALDGLVAGAVTFGLWKLTGRLADLLERPARPGALAPA